MSMNDIDGSAVRNCVEHLGSSFVTKDVSEDADVKRRHGSFAANSHYHATVGRWLSENAASLGIVKTGVSTSRGMRWEKPGATTPEGPSASAQAVPPSKTTVPDDEPAARSVESARSDPSGGPQDVPPAAPDRYGPQYAGDAPFTARMRFHQSWWRADVLGVGCGTGPRSSSPELLGNMLDEAAATAGRNFLTLAIHEAALQRLGAGVEPFRCTRNLLSSQPMCFNLFAPLGVMDPELANACTASLLPDPADCARFRKVVIEHAPSPRIEYLDDRTAFDAYIEYERADGSDAFLAIETKLTEPFSPNTAKSSKYLAFVHQHAEVWDAEKTRSLINVSWFQLLRDHLLAVRVAAHPDSHYTSGMLAVVHHPLDSGCAKAVSGYRAHLVDGDRQVLALTLDDVVDRWRPVVSGTEHAGWLDAFEVRYVDLAGSDAAWRARRGTRS